MGKKIDIKSTLTSNKVIRNPIVRFSISEYFSKYYESWDFLKININWLYFSKHRKNITFLQCPELNTVWTKKYTWTYNYIYLISKRITIRGQWISRYSSEIIKIKRSLKSKKYHHWEKWFVAWKGDKEASYFVELRCNHFFQSFVLDKKIIDMQLCYLSMHATFK